MIAPSGHNIIISPIGDLDSSLIGKINKGVSQRFGYPVKIVSLLKSIDFALSSDRDQYHSTQIIDRLASMAPPQTIRILAICDKDLFIPILTHVYGEAQLGGMACIISTFRLRDELPVINPQKTFYQRAIKEAIHELGHTFKLRHCKDPTCSMHYCRVIKDVDNKSEQFCRYCKIFLEDEMKRIGKDK